MLRSAMVQWTLVFSSAVLLAPSGRCLAADEAKPILVIASPGHQHMLEVAALVGELSADKQLAARVGKLLGKLLNIAELRTEDLPGVDKARPWGGALLAHGSTSGLVGIVPVSDAAALVGHLAGTTEAPTATDGLYQFKAAERDMFARERDGWLYVGFAASDVDGISDPQALLSEVTANYDLAMRFRLTDLPPEDRQAHVDQMTAMFPADVPRTEGEGDAQYAFRSAMMTHELQVLKSVLIESEQTKIGWRIDREKTRLLGELSIRPISGTSLAAKIAALDSSTSSAAGILTEQDTIALHLNVSFDAALGAELQTLLDSYGAAVMESVTGSMAGAENSTAVESLARKFLDAMKSTIATGKLNLAVRTIGKGVPLTMVAAVRVADASALEAAVLEAGANPENDKGFEAVQLAAEEHSGIKVHAFTLAKTEPPSLLDKLFKGRKVLVAVGNDHLYFAAGPKASAELKAAFAAKPAAAPALLANLRMGTVANIAAPILGDPQMGAIIGFMGLNFVQGADGAMDDSLRIQFDNQGGQLAGTMDAGNGTLRVTGMLISFAQQLLSAQTPGRPAGLVPQLPRAPAGGLKLPGGRLPGAKAQ